jgi:hypothetical protein
MHRAFLAVAATATLLASVANPHFIEGGGHDIYGPPQWWQLTGAGAHDAIVAWCRLHGRRLAGPRWEVYGHWTDDEAKLRADVYYLLEPARPASST